MENIRQFKRMGLWDFIELLEKNCIGSGKCETYFLYLDEIKLRKFESISEGGDHKLIFLAEQLLREFQKEMQANSSFCTEKQSQDFLYTVEVEIAGK